MAFTYFFRDQYPLEKVLDYLLPSMVNVSFIRIWSAGSAMGQEPYSIAMLLRERLGESQFRKVKIFATDIDDSDHYRKAIAAGRYLTSDLRRIPPGMYERYFSPDPEFPGYSVISPEIKASVRFHRHDLLTYEPVASGFILVVCKNVLLHFTEEQRIRVLTMFHQSLADDGVLLHEHTQPMPAELGGMFEQVFSDARAYRKRAG